MSIPVSIQWQDEQLSILDQRKLPLEIQYVTLETIESVFEAIVSMQVRGAPAIGIVAAYGLAQQAQQIVHTEMADFLAEFNQHYDYLASSRPTAVNLFWALNRLAEVIRNVEKVEDAKVLLLLEAEKIYKEDEVTCRTIGEYGLELLDEVTNVMTVCNAGSIATAKYGTALAPFHLGIEKGKKFSVYACETRPVFQGSRLTVWELQQSGVDVTLITDSMAAQTIVQKGIEAIIVGADRIAANGDTANKIGTLGLAILAKELNIPFYVAAPSSTFDLATKTGTDIPIEERAAAEITSLNGVQIAPNNTKVYNPAFDVTPSRYITAIITEKGIAYPNFEETIKKLIG